MKRKKAASPKPKPKPSTSKHARTTTANTTKVTTIPSEPKSPSIGALVRYYREGWYHGHVVELTKKVIRVKPIGPVGSNRDAVKCAHDDVEVVE